MPQWYLISPGRDGVNENVSPTFSAGDENDLSSATTVCAPLPSRSGSRSVHVTAVPAGTVTAPGAKA